MTDPSPIRLVPLSDPHRAATLRWMNDPALMPRLNRLRPISPDEHDAWFAALPERADARHFAILAGSEEEHVGNVWLHAIEAAHRKAEVRIMIGESARQNQGLGSRALGQLAGLAFGELGLHRLYAYVLADNSAALRAFARAGFAPEGTLLGDRWTGRGFVDCILVARLQ